MRHIGGLKWNLWIDDAVSNAQHMVDRDSQLLELLALGRSGNIIRVWQNSPAIVVSRRDTRAPGYAKAVKYFKAQGVPIVVRCSGGTAVVHNDGVLNISLIYKMKTEYASIQQSYLRLCSFVQEYFLPDIHSEIGARGGAFCDGEYNLLIQGRKVAGTSQRMKRYKGNLYILSHISLLVATSPIELVDSLITFNDLAGINHNLTAAAVTSVHLHSKIKTASELIIKFEKLWSTVYQ